MSRVTCNVYYGVSLAQPLVVVEFHQQTIAAVGSVGRRLFHRKYCAWGHLVCSDWLKRHRNCQFQRENALLHDTFDRKVIERPTRPQRSFVDETRLVVCVWSVEREEIVRFSNTRNSQKITTCTTCDSCRQAHSCVLQVSNLVHCTIMPLCPPAWNYLTGIL